MRSVKSMKMAKIGYIIMSLLLCMLGVALIVFPKLSASVIAVLFGTVLVLFGIVKLVGYFSRDLFRLAFQYDLAFGLLLMVLGMIIIVKRENLMVFISLILGIYILADGLLKIQIALDAKVFGIGQWWLILVAAILAGVTGSMLVFRPAAGGELLVILTGIGMLTEGILSLITVLTAVRIISHQKPDRIVEADARM